MKKLLPLTFFLFFVGPLASQSIANYTAVRSPGAGYLSISSTGNAFTWRNITSSTSDDNRSDFTNIGFDFWYNGTRYTQFCVSTNGYIDFSSSTDDGGPIADDFGYDNTAFTNANLASATRPAIAAFYDDLTTQGNNDPLGSSIKYRLSGSSPNRILTVEWINLTVATNTTPALNFQVQLFESTGVIRVNYGSMSAGTNVFSYCMGINSATLGATPAASELKMLQANNGTVLSNAVQNNLSGVPQSNSRYTFTPPTPAAATGSLSFSAVSSSGMTLGWTDWASNETGYVIYNSTDGVTYNFVAQTAANAVSSAVTGLFPGTTYYWKVYAVTEGCLSTALSGTNPTSAAGNKTSTGSGNWGNPTTWSPSGVPTSGDNVTVANGHSVSINTNASCNNLVVGGGTSGVLQFNNGGTGYAMSVNNVTVNTGASFLIPLNSNATGTVTFNGNVVNNSTVNFASDANSMVKSYFVKNGNQTISGTGSFTFHTIDVNLGSSNTNSLDISTTSFTAPAGFLNLQNGTFKLAANNTATITPFTSSTTSIPASAGLWLNTPNITYSTTTTLSLYGKLTAVSGTFNVGDAANEDLLISGGTLNIQGGNFNVGGKMYTSPVNDLASVSITGGTITVPVYSSTNTTTAPINLGGAGSTFTMSAGQIIIPYEGGSGAQDLGYVNTIAAGSVTGGTLQIGNSSTPASQSITINSSLSIGNLVINSANAAAGLKTNSLAVISNIAINSGTLNANNLNISLGGNWTSAGSFTPGTAVVNFSSSATQYISRSGGETFNHLQFDGVGVKTFSSPITASGNFSVSTGSSVDVSTSNNQLTVKGNYINNGTFTARTGLVHFNGTTAQTIGGTSVTDFYDMTLGNSAGASLTGAENLLGTLTLTAGTLNTNSQVFTMVSTATACARIAQITGTGDITGNVTVQRYAPGGTTGWALWGTPISSALTLNDWDDDIPISCATCPDGSAGGFLSIYTYDETISGLYDDANAYIPLSTINDPISATKGYWVYLGLAQYTTAAITIDVTGSVRKFNQTIPLNYTNYGSSADDGWNLIQNPYPSPISWSALKGTTSGIDNALYVYNTDLNGGAGAFATYINGISSPATSSGGIGNTIPMSQAFYVHSTGATALNATEAIKVAGNPTYLKTNNTSTVLSLVRLNLTGYGYNDETVLYVQPGATSNFDNAYDAVKMRGQDPSAPTIALESGVDLFQVNGVAPITGNFVMPLKTLTGYSGSYTIAASGFSTFPHGACIKLYDKFTNTTTDLKSSNYNFNLADTTTVARFELRITINNLNITASVQQPVCQAPNNGKIIAGGTGTGPWNYYWTSNGSPVKTSLNKNGNDTLSNLSSGYYDLEVDATGMCNTNSSSYQVIPQVPSTAAFTSIDTLDLNVSASIAFTNLSTNASSYSWNFGDGSGISSLASPVYYYSNTGTYTVTLVSSSSSGCSDTTSKVITVIYGMPAGINTYGMNTSGMLVKTLTLNEYQVEQKLNEEQVFTIRLTDTWGKVVKDFGTVTTNHLQVAVNLNNYARGMYMLTITSGATQKVVKLPAR